MLDLIGRLSAGGGAGHALESTGPKVRALSMEGRMTLCNMAIEAGSRVGLVAVDDTTLKPATLRRQPCPSSSRANASSTSEGRPGAGARAKNRTRMLKPPGSV